MRCASGTTEDDGPTPAPIVTFHPPLTTWHMPGFGNAVGQQSTQAACRPRRTLRESAPLTSAGAVPPTQERTLAPRRCDRIRIWPLTLVSPRSSLLVFASVPKARKPDRR